MQLLASVIARSHTRGEVMGNSSAVPLGMDRDSEHTARALRALVSDIEEDELAMLEE
jgi:hypothetical protein